MQRDNLGFALVHPAHKRYKVQPLPCSARLCTASHAATRALRDSAKAHSMPGSDMALGRRKLLPSDSNSEVCRTRELQPQQDQGCSSSAHSAGGDPSCPCQRAAPQPAHPKARFLIRAVLSEGSCPALMACLHK